VAEPTARLHLLWAVIDGYPPQFVAAFSDGEVDAWRELHEKRRGEAETFARGFGEDTVRGFFVTTVDVERPAPPRYIATPATPSYWRVFDCEACVTLPERFPHRGEAEAEAEYLTSRLLTQPNQHQQPDSGDSNG
jgi:hypothetical protein